MIFLRYSFLPPLSKVFAEGQGYPRRGQPTKGVSLGRKALRSTKVFGGVGTFFHPAAQGADEGLLSKKKSHHIPSIFGVRCSMFDIFFGSDPPEARID